MKISELIKSLDSILKNHGDIEVTVDTIYGWEEVDEGPASFVIIKDETVCMMKKPYIKRVHIRGVKF